MALGWADDEERQRRVGERAGGREQDVEPLAPVVAADVGHDRAVERKAEPGPEGAPLDRVGGPELVEVHAVPEVVDPLARDPHLL